MRTQTKAALAMGAAFAAVLVVVTLILRAAADDGPDQTASTGKDSVLVREDSRVLGEKGSTEVTFVEFLDFECEACGAAYPIVEQLRQQYAGEVTFVARYFPLSGHFNAERAARAVESAARQGKFEEMYQKMYETQKSWGEGQEPLDELFRGFARDLDLDLEQYDTDYESDEVRHRVEKDRQDGLRLGVQGTPTFYVDGKLLEPTSVQDFTDALDEALGR